MLNHNVKRFTTEKAAGFNYRPASGPHRNPGNEGKSFTFTGPLADPHLEFTIKLYHDHKGVTDHLTHYERGHTLTFEDPWGAIKYKGPGIFMAGGAGITRFLAILRNLSESGKLDGNALWFSKKTDKGIFLEEEVRAMLGDRLRLLITGEPSTRHENARIDEKYLEPHAGSFDQYFYVCGP